MTDVTWLTGRQLDEMARAFHPASPVQTLVAEVRFLRFLLETSRTCCGDCQDPDGTRVATLEDGIRARCGQWDADAPDALAYVVTDSFRRLLDEEADRE